MDCPRCKLTMISSSYEQEKVLSCQSCWGYWLSNTQLDRILHKMIYKFDDHEKQEIINKVSHGQVAVPQSKDNDIECPSCQKKMVKRPYQKDWPIIIDECFIHGIWLDTGEIKALQIYMEEQLKKEAVLHKLEENEEPVIKHIKSLEKRVIAVEEKLDYLINFIRKVRGQ